MRSAYEREYIDFVTAQLPALKRLAFMLCGDDQRADDLVQESLTKLYVSWENAREARNLEGYVRKVLIHRYIDETRRPWYRVRLFASLPDVRPAVDSGSEDRTVLRTALASLPPGQRAVLVLRFLCDMSVTDVSELLGHSEGTVRSQTSHGLVKLRRLLSESEFTLTSRG